MGFQEGRFFMKKFQIPELEVIDLTTEIMVSSDEPETADYMLGEDDMNVVRAE